MAISHLLVRQRPQLCHVLGVDAREEGRRALGGLGARGGGDGALGDGQRRVIDGDRLAAQRRDERLQLLQLHRRKLQLALGLEQSRGALEDGEVVRVGAAQLVGNDDIPPAAVHDERLLEAEHAEYLYLAAVRFVRQVKKGPFHEHSPYLNDISQLASWQRVVDGLVRMYDGEVLGKLPVVQHLPFGELLKWE